MASRRVRFAFCALLAFAIWYAPVISARAQQYSKPGSQQSGMRQQRQQGHQTTPQKKTVNQRTQNKQQPAARGGADATGGAS